MSTTIQPTLSNLKYNQKSTPLPQAPNRNESAPHDSYSLDILEGVAVWGGSVLAGAVAPMLIPAAAVAGVCLSKAHDSDNEEAIKMGLFTSGLAAVGLAAGAIGLAPAAVGIAALIGYRAML